MTAKGASLLTICVGVGTFRFGRLRYLSIHSYRSLTDIEFPDRSFPNLLSCQIILPPMNGCRAVYCCYELLAPGISEPKVDMRLRRVEQGAGKAGKVRL